MVKEGDIVAICLLSLSYPVFRVRVLMRKVGFVLFAWLVYILNPASVVNIY